ncbi:MAG: polyketide antibiotic transporter [Rhodoglobus sp.]
MLRLILLRLRRDRVILPIWIVSTGLLALAGASGVGSEFATDTDRASVLKLAIATPTLLAIRGVPNGSTLGSYVNFQVFCYLAIMAALMSTFMVTRHSRADEERGRMEMLAATPVGRITPLLATFVVGVLANAVLGVVVALGFSAGGLPGPGAWVGGLASAAVGLAFVGLAAVVSQLAPTGRSANSISAALVGVAFLLRAVGDVLGTPDLATLTVVSAWPSWLSPIGWGQQVFAFTRNDLSPLWLAGGLAALSCGVALVMQARRDIGSSVLRERSGRAVGSAALRSNLALAWRLQWPSVVGWAIGGAALGSLGGLLAQRIADTLDVSGSLHDILAGFVPGGKGSIVDLLVVAILGIGGVLAAAAGAQAIMRARGEEADGRAELVLAAPLGRVRWLLDYVIVAVASAVIVSLATGLVASLSFLSADGGSDRFWSSLAAGLVQVPAAIAFIAATTLVFAVLPRATVGVGWGLIAAGLAVGQFGGLLKLPDWVRNISPFTHTPAVPGPEPEWVGMWTILAVALAILGLSVALVRRRQLTS